MIRTCRYRLYPTPEQVSALTEIFSLAHWLYNHALAFRRKRWQESRYSVSYNEQSAMWKQWRNEQPEDNPLRWLNMTAGQQVLRRLDRAYRQFLSGKRGKPRFKPARYFNSVNYKPGDGAGIKDRRLYLQNVGLVSVKWHRELPAGALKNIVVVRKPSGWYVLLQIEITQPDPKPSQNPRKKAVHHLARFLEHIAEQRRDWWHKVVHWLVSQYGVIVLEELNLRFMLRNGHLARAAQDVAPGLFYEILDYKAVDAGVQVIEVNPRNTSQHCSGCGVKVEKALSVRVHACPQCGFTADRDVNAALNILSPGGVATVRR